VGVTGNTIAVVGRGEVVTWDLPTGVHVPSARADRNDSVRTTRLDRGELSGSLWDGSLPVSISPGLSYVAAMSGSRPFYDYDVYDASTGMHLQTVPSWGGSPWFTPDGQEFWILGSIPASLLVHPEESGWYSGNSKGWAIVRGSGSDVTKLERLDPTTGPSRGFPSRGCQVADDGWVLNSTGKRLLWLHPHWRSAEVHRVCGKEYLLLLQPGLPEVVVVELSVE